MTATRWPEVERLYHAALERAADERAAFLVEACAGDDDLRCEVESLLAYRTKAQNFIEVPAGRGDPMSSAVSKVVQNVHDGSRPGGLVGRVLGVYEVDALIAVGGMGEVYRARDSRLKREVAIKVLPSDLSGDRDRLRRFEQEAHAVGALNHPNILAIYDVGTYDGSPYLVTELLEGETLRARLGREPLPVRKVVEYAIEMARGLAAAHDKGIVHRDLKPENLFLTRDGRLKILDFGLAKLTERSIASDAAVAATQSGIILGTVGYMAPEQVRGQPADTRSDVFSCGVILYEMLAGVRPFRGDSAVDVMQAILKEDVPEVPSGRSISTALDRVVRRCLEKAPEERLQSARDLGFVLEAISGSSSASGSATAVVVPHFASRRWTLMALMVAALVVAALALAMGRLTGTAPEVSATRFLVTPPDRSTFQPGVLGGWGSPVVVSPEGRQIVFVVVGPEGNRRLWIRALDATAMQPMPGTEGASGPFWSPDGRWIAFFANGKLKRMAIGGRETQTLCDASDAGAGGTWNRDNVILFSPAASGEGGLARVPAEGGARIPVTTLDEAHGETNHLWPQFLPDGRHYLYVVHGRDDSGLYVGSLDSKDRTRLLDAEQAGGDVSQVEYAEPGYLLFVRDRALMARRFDAKRLALAGDAIRVADGVLKEGPGSSAFSVSVNGVLAYWDGGAPPDTRLTWVRRDGASAGTVGPAGAYFELALAPDERTITVTRFAPDEKGLLFAIWLIDVQRSTSTKFTFSNGTHPMWSRDGARIAFASSSQGNPPSLYQKSSDSVDQGELLFQSPGASRPTDWTADGQTLIFQSRDPVTRWDLWMLSTGGARMPTPFLRTKFNETDGRISPDGQWIAYVSDESGAPEVYVTSFPNARGKWRLSTSGGSAPQWSRNGKELFYVATDRKLMVVPVKAGARLEAGAAKALFDVPSLPGPFGRTEIFAEQYAPAADGERFLIRVPAGETSFPPATVVLNWTAGIRK